MIFKIVIVLIFIFIIKFERLTPIKINILSDKLQKRTVMKTNFFFNPWLITNKFYGPIAIIREDPIIKPWKKLNKLILFF